MSREMKDSGIDWIGEIPSNWDIKPIKRNYKIISGATPKSNNEENWGGNITWITPADFKASGKYIATGRKNITEKGYNSCSTTIVPTNSIIFSKRAPVGTVAINSNELCTNQGCLSCVPFKEMNSSFGYYSMLAGKCIFEISAQGTTFMEISANDFANIKLPIAPLEEQEEIAKFLDVKCESIDQAIQKQKDIVIKLKEYKQSIITKAVTKGLNPNVKMKDNDIDWIREIPESWDIIPLKVLFKENKRRNTDLTNSNLLSLSYGRIIQKDIDSNFGLLPDNFSKYTIVNDGDIVLRLTDLQNDHKSLRTGLVTQSGIITSAYVTLTPKKELCSRYFHYLLHSYDIQKVFYTMGEGIRQNLSYDELSKNIRLVMPSLKEQQSIANYLDSKCLAIDESIKRSNKIIQKLEEYKKSLIYNAVTGKIDCRGEVK